MILKATVFSSEINLISGLYYYNVVVDMCRIGLLVSPLLSLLIDQNKKSYRITLSTITVPNHITLSTIVYDQ